MKKAVGTQIYLSPELKQKVSTHCRENYTQLSKLVRDLLTQYLEQQNNKPAPPEVELELPDYPPKYLMK